MPFRFRLLGVLGILLTTLAFATVAHAADDFRTVVMNGQAAPGTGAGVVFDGFSDAMIDDFGRVAFKAVLTGTGVSDTNRSGVWSEGGGAGLALVARQGDPALGTPLGADYGYTYFPNLNGQGQVAFQNFLQGSGLYTTGVWSEGGGTGLAHVASVGQPTPVPGLDFASAGQVSINDSGAIAFTSNLSGAGVTSSNDSAIWSDRGGGGLSIVSREGDPAPGTGAGVSFKSFGLPRINGVGQITFRAYLTGSGINATNYSGIWSDGGGSGMALIARAGDAPPGTGPGVTYTNFEYHIPTINDAGQVAYSAQVSLGGTGFSTGAWSQGGGAGLELVALEGEPVPGMGPGVYFGGIGDPKISGSGQIVFYGEINDTVAGTEDRALWTHSGPAGVNLAVRAGTPAPGAGAGVVFETFYRYTINRAEQILFFADLAGPNISNSNDRGIWATDLDGNLQLIVREGDLFDVNDDPMIDDLRQVSYIDLICCSSSEDGRYTLFNERGQVAILLGFTDHTEGIFVSDKVAVTPGDLDLDGDVDNADLGLAAGNFTGAGGSTSMTYADGDIDGDGDVDNADLGVIAGNFTGAMAGLDPSLEDVHALNAVPEPASIALLALGAPLLLRPRPGR